MSKKTEQRPLAGRKIFLGLAVGLVGWAVAVADAAPPSATSDWPLARGNPQGTGAVTTQLPEKLAERWRYEAGEAIDATVIVADQTVYVADAMGTIHAIALADGKPQWQAKTELGFLAPPAVNEDTLVIGDIDGVVYAFDTKTGERRWTFATENEINAGAMFYGDLVLVSSQDGNLYALKTSDGSLVWKYETADQIQCSPTIAGSRTFLGGCDGQWHSVDLETGKAAAEPLPLGGPTLSTPAVVGDRAFLTTHGGLVLAIDWKSNERLWQFEDPERNQEYRSSPAATEQTVIVSSQFRKVIALDAETGKLRWSRMLRRFAEASPVIAGDDVWIAATDGRLYRFGLSDGAIRWEYEIRGSFQAAPVIAGGHLLVANDDGTVIAFAGTSD